MRISELIKIKGKRCVYCGEVKNLTVDHIQPKSRGGSNKIENLQVLCLACNQEKADRVIFEERYLFMALNN